MHRYREYGVISEEDETLRRAFRDGFKRAGLSHAQFLEALAWYRDHAASEANDERLAEKFVAYAVERGWQPTQWDSAINLYCSIRDDGPAAVTATPRPEEDRATLVVADELLRSDPGRYWKDGELQDAVFEARERLAAAPGIEAELRHTTTDPQRIGEVEALLRDPSGEGQRRYWNDAGLRADYAQALARVHGASDADGRQASSASSASTSGNAENAVAPAA